MGMPVKEEARDVIGWRRKVGERPKIHPGKGTKMRSRSMMAAGMRRLSNSLNAMVIIEEEAIVRERSSSSRECSEGILERRRKAEAMTIPPKRDDALRIPGGLIVECLFTRSAIIQADVGNKMSR